MIYSSLDPPNPSNTTQLRFLIRRNMAPGPFCCYSAIPSTVRHLVHILPDGTTHKPLNRLSTSAPLLSSFLAYMTLELGAVPTTTPNRYSARHYAIVQVKKTHPLLPTTLPQPLPKASPSSATLFSIPLDTKQRPSSARSESGDTGFSEVSYFVPLEKVDRPTVLDQGSLVKGRAYREITTHVAQESLRPPGSGIMIGDGENWRLLNGMEKLWCEDHRIWFELRVWVRET